MRLHQTVHGIALRDGCRFPRSESYVNTPQENPCRMPDDNYPERMTSSDAVTRLTSLRQYQGDGKRAPHKPLLVLLALGHIRNTGSSAMPWSLVEERLGSMLAEFGTPSRQGSASAAYPFTRLRSDGVWQLTREVPDDKVGPLRDSPIEGMFTTEIESSLRAAPDQVLEAARLIVEQQFPLTVAPDVLTAAGLDPDLVFGIAPRGMSSLEERRRRDPAWRHRILEAWDRSCAFCGFDGAIAGAPVGIEAAHIRWFNFGGPDSLDNGLALCSLHHKLLDRGVLGFEDSETIRVSASFSAISSQGRAIYDLHAVKLRPRPGTPLPSTDNVHWHGTEVFKGESLAT